MDQIQGNLKVMSVEREMMTLLEQPSPSRNWPSDSHCLRALYSADDSKGRRRMTAIMTTVPMTGLGSPVQWSVWPIRAATVQPYSAVHGSTQHPQTWQ